MVVMREEIVGGRECTERRHDLDHGTTGICPEMDALVGWSDWELTARLEDEQAMVGDCPVTVDFSVVCV